MPSIVSPTRSRLGVTVHFSGQWTRVASIQHPIPWYGFAVLCTAFAKTQHLNPTSIKTLGTVGCFVHSLLVSCREGPPRGPWRTSGRKATGLRKWSLKYATAGLTAWLTAAATQRPNERDSQTLHNTPTLPHIPLIALRFFFFF